MAEDNRNSVPATPDPSDGETVEDGLLWVPSWLLVAVFIAGGLAALAFVAATALGR